MNATYLAAVKETAVPKGSTNSQKDQINNYNKMLKETRKTEFAPVSEPLRLNCDLLFGIAKELTPTEKAKSDADKILHPNGARLFLNESLDDLYWFDSSNKAQTEAADIESLASLYLVNELGKNWDSGAASTFFTCRKDQNGVYKFYGSPVWDYDNTMGNATGVLRESHATGKGSPWPALGAETLRLELRHVHCPAPAGCCCLLSPWRLGQRRLCRGRPPERQSSASRPTSHADASSLRARRPAGQEGDGRRTGKA